MKYSKLKSEKINLEEMNAQCIQNSVNLFAIEFIWLKPLIVVMIKFWFSTMH